MKTKKKAAKAGRVKMDAAKVYSITCKGCGHMAKIHVPKECWPAIWLETARRVRVKAIEDVAAEMAGAIARILRETSEK